MTSCLFLVSLDKTFAPSETCAIGGAMSIFVVSTEKIGLLT